MAGSLLIAAEKLLSQGIHPTTIASSFQASSRLSLEVLRDMSSPILLGDHASLLKAATTSLNSKIVSNYSNTLAPIAVDAVMKLVDNLDQPQHVDLNDIRVIRKVGGTIEDTALVDGVVLKQSVITSSGGPTRVEKAKIGLIQFQLSPPKPDLDNQIVVNDYRQMDKILQEERKYLLEICKKIKKCGCNVLLIQKSILRDAVTDMSLHFLSKLKIMVIKDVERDEVEFLCKSIGCQPIADVETFTEDKLGHADLVEETSADGTKIARISGIKFAVQPKNAKNQSLKTMSIVVRGANQLILDEAERSIHDALCVIRSIVKQPALIAGGGAPEIEISQKLADQAKLMSGMERYCVEAFAEAMEVIPITLAENAGLDPVRIVTELRNRHANNDRNAGINVRKGIISNILEENVVQPLLVSTSAVQLASECIRMILKIDDIVQAR